MPNILSRYISANARFPYKDRYWITAYRYYDLLSGKAIYAIPLYVSGTRPKGGEKESPSFPSPKDRNARTPSINCTFARPILPSRIKSARFPALYLNYFPYDWPKYVSFSFFSLSLQVEAWFLSSLHFNLVALGSSYGKIINEKEKWWWIWLVVVEGDTRSSRLNYAGC